MAWSVVFHPEVTSWVSELDRSSAEQVAAAIDRLADEGPHLRRPLADTITGSALHNLKELRPGSSKRSEIRILFAFDPSRRAILLVAGNKTGEWSRWYKRMIPVAERRLAEHIARGKEGGWS